MLNKAYHAKELNSEVDLSSEGTFENKDNSPSYLPLSTVNHIYKNRSKIIIKKVNVI